jgi:hypothetical protein
MNKDIIAAMEREVSRRYGPDAASDFRVKDEEEQKKIQEELESFYKKIEKIKNMAKSSAKHRTCPVCEEYSFKAKDDVYMIKFGCCFKCFVEHIENRESRFLSLSEEERRIYFAERRKG